MNIKHVICVDCNSAPVTSFKQIRCNKCRSAYNRNYYSQSIEVYLARALASSRRRAKAKGTTNDLTLDQLLDLWQEQDGRCALSGVAMTYEITNGAPNMYNASLDRIRPGLAYTIKNVQLVCSRANQIKGDLDNSGINWWVTQIFGHLNPKKRRARCK